MKSRLWSVLAILVAPLLFNGCFEIYYDIIQNSDRTFEIRQTVGIRQEVFAQLADFMNIKGTSADSSTSPDSKPTAEDMIDSMRHSFAHKRDSLLATNSVIGHNGITAFTAYDTTRDSMVLFTMQSTVSDIDSLPVAFQWMQSSANVKPGVGEGTDSDNVRLSVRKTQSTATIHFLPPLNAAGFMSFDMPGAEQLFKDLHLHYRVFSLSLEKSHDKNIHPIPGGEERTFGVKELSKKGKHLPKLDASFVIHSNS